MITVHHLNNSRSQRVLWLLEELGVEYQIKHYQRDAKTMLAPPELKAVHPLGKSPVITDGDLTIAESGTIIEYLMERYGNGKLITAIGTPERLRYNYWMHYAEGSMMPLLVMKLIFGVIPKRSPALIRPIAKAIVANVEKNFLGPNMRTHLDFIESELNKSTWFAGEEITAADVQMSFVMEASSARGPEGNRPKSAAFVKRIQDRPAYQRALKKGGRYQLMS
ncbi:glutathione S-transferase family protein [Stenotrophobium rhamnosiphilum]|uniref:glutathione transferase n=1 Tax=Stenotrophobium rhamnosiphilum TaxID=2029166 RepID=A0A2T5MK59_9GAMM|nr:glutathione S-transferase [Stenotrophobium rhamnosiphilum]PTU32948.1 glutathione S-transferase [Stenotrophobium rhamnosiphilum]